MARRAPATWTSPQAIVLKRNALARKVNELANAVYTAQSNKAKMAPNAVDDAGDARRIAADMDGHSADGMLGALGERQVRDTRPAPARRQLTDLIAAQFY